MLFHMPSNQVPFTVSLVMPTVTSETISAITIVAATSNIIYEIFKKALIDKTHANGQNKMDPEIGKERSWQKLW